MRYFKGMVGMNENVGFLGGRTKSGKRTAQGDWGGTSTGK